MRNPATYFLYGIFCVLFILFLIIVAIMTIPFLITILIIGTLNVVLLRTTIYFMGKRDEERSMLLSCVRLKRELDIQRKLIRHFTSDTSSYNQLKKEYFSTLKTLRKKGVTKNQIKIALSFI